MDLGIEGRRRESLALYVTTVTLVVSCPLTTSHFFLSASVSAPRRCFPRLPSFTNSPFRRLLHILALSAARVCFWIFCPRTRVKKKVCLHYCHCARTHGRLGSGRRMGRSNHSTEEHNGHSTEEHTVSEYIEGRSRRWHCRKRNRIDVTSEQAVLRIRDCNVASRQARRVPSYSLKSRSCTATRLHRPCLLKTTAQAGCK